jgi:hypothetical protein
LKVTDKAALLLWVLSFAIGANTERFALLAISIGCAGLALAWLYAKHTRQHRSEKKSKNLLAESR